MLNHNFNNSILNGNVHVSNDAVNVHEWCELPFFRRNSEVFLSNKKMKLAFVLDFFVTFFFKEKSKEKIILFFLVTFILPFAGLAQKQKQLLYEGNKSYYGGKPMEAANYYKKALKEKQDFHKANFNYGDALYKTAYAIKSKKMLPPDKRMTPDSAANILFEQAAEQFDVTAKSISDPDTIQRAWHNYGNSKLFQSNFEDAIYGYKKALKLNPKDEDTRYNLAFAQRELKKQQDQQKKNDKNKKEDKKDKGDKKDDKKDKGEPKDNKDKGDKEKQQQPQMSKEQAEQMLNALKNNEKKMQEARVKKGDPAEKRKIDKDW